MRRYPKNVTRCCPGSDSNHRERHLNVKTRRAGQCGHWLVLPEILQPTTWSVAVGALAASGAAGFFEISRQYRPRVTKTAGDQKKCSNYTEFQVRRCFEWKRMESLGELYELCDDSSYN